MILENLNKKVNPKRNTYFSSGILEVDKIVGQKLEAEGWGWDEGKEKWGERREKGRIGEILGERDG